MIRAGYFGKLPARGDFVRHGLSAGFVAAWDAWLQLVLPASRSLLAAAWEAAWLDAPAWAFALPPEVCGPEPVCGVWMPSVDSVGRRFPLTLAVVGTSAADPGVLTAMEAAGRAAIEQAWPPDSLQAALPAFGEPRPWSHNGLTWSTLGGPRRPAWTFTSSGLPDPETFALMLDAGANGSPDDPVP